MKTYYGTNNGRVRNNNEDNLIVNESDNYLLCVVADGMGGHNAGEVASKIAVDSINEYFIAELDKGQIKIPRFIIESINFANKVIYDQASSKDEFSGMGTTVTMVVIDKNENIAYIGNVGDSRTYQINKNYIKQVTDDHTFVQELVKKGEITDKEAKRHCDRNVITRAVGSEKNIITDIFEIELKHDDKLLLCSDGLTSHLNDEEILSIVEKYNEDSIEHLINSANENGGTDNITVIIIDIAN